MNERLSPLQLLPPSLSRSWTGISHRPLPNALVTSQGVSIQLSTPLFWYDPPWCKMPVEQADSLAVAIGKLGVLVSAMRSDLSAPGQDSEFHRRAADDRPRDRPAPNDTEATQPPPVFPRMVPYRPERYGFEARDFDGATVIDIRLMMPRDAMGRFAFSPEQLQRWEATPSGEPLAGGGWVPAATFPPDVTSLTHLAGKLNQLRVLAPEAAMVIAIEPYRMKKDLKRILLAQPDGVVIRMSDASLSGLQLAKLVKLARQELCELGSPDLPLWIVPGKITPDDAVKLLALGASAVAVDTWCEDLIQEAEEATAAQTTHSSFRSFAVRTQAIDSKYLQELAAYRLRPWINRVLGLASTLTSASRSEMLGSFDADWSSELEISLLGAVG